MANRRAQGFIAAAVIAAVVALLPLSEGVRHHAYRDAGGIWTICDGHTEGVKPGDTATDAQCAQYLHDDVAERYPYIDRCLPPTLSLNERIAYLHAVYNGGPAIICGSSIQRLLRTDEHRKACESLLRWVCVRTRPGDGDASGQCATSRRDHRQLAGLVKRRTLEMNICLGRSPWQPTSQPESPS